MALELKHYTRKQFHVKGIDVTEDNMEDVAKWTKGEIKEDEEGRYIDVPVHRPLNKKQKQARVGSFVLLSDTGFKVYTDRAMANSFDETSAIPEVYEAPTQPVGNVFENAPAEEEKEETDGTSD